MSDDRYLLIAGQNNEPEIFYTLEGEGKYIGQPSVFLRLFGCNLTCSAFASADSPHGCDSFVSWSIKNKRSFIEVFEIFEREDFIYKLRAGAILKITGGEPLLRPKPLIAWLHEFVNRYMFTPRIDFETNGTFMPDPALLEIFRATFTVSPKLSTNGDAESKTYVPEVLAWHVKNLGSTFKFVINKDTDVEEVWRKYLTDSNGINMPLNRVWFMPCAGSKAEHDLRATAVAEEAKKAGVNFSPRLHLVLWDKALRV